MLRKIAWGSLIVVLGLTSLLTVRYRVWGAEAVRQLESGSSLIETAAGPMEVSRSKFEGSVVLLLHGTPGGYDQLGRLGELASDAGFAWLAPSRPGYLRTPLAVGRTPAEQADAYLALLDALGIGSVAVVGISGGGPSAIQFAIRHPDRCWALVDLMGVSRARRPDEIHAADDLEGSVIGRLLGTNFGGWLLIGLLARQPEAMLEFVISDESIRRRILEHPERRDAFVTLAASALLLPQRRNAGMRNDMEQFEAMEIPRLEAIRAPTLVLHGTADRNVPLAMGQLVAGRVPGAHLVTFENADHFMVVSHPQEVFGALFDFLREQQP